MIIFGACSDDSNPVTSTGPRVFDLFALWDTASGRLDGLVLSLAVKDSFLFAGTNDSGVYRSSNNGESWIKTNSGMPASNSVAAFLIKGSNLFAGTSNGIYRSSNNGSNWTSSGLGWSTLSLVQKDTLLFAGTTSHVYRSTDDGLTWNTAGFTGVNIINTLVVKGSKIFAGTNNAGIYYSTDNGANWTPLVIEMSIITIHSLAVQDTNLFAATDGGIFRTSNDSIWTYTSEGLYSTLSLGSPRSIYIVRSHVFAGFLGNAGAYLSLNSGSSWISVNSGLPRFSVYAFTYNGSYIFAGGQDISGYGGVWRHPL
jgi:photosystem II stability/assembly factor-like uncharacterized protein